MKAGNFVPGKSIQFVPPHLQEKAFLDRFTERLMRATYNHPKRMKRLILGGSIFGLVLLMASFFIPFVGVPIGVAATLGILGGAGGLLGLISGVLQHKIFGFPIEEKKIFTNSKVTYNTATAVLRVDEKSLPILHIKAKDPLDAGFVEGYILGKAIKYNLKKLNFLYTFVRPFIGAPRKEEDLKPLLENVLKTVPEQYQMEMLGKVAGYNKWLKVNSPKTKPLSFEKYFLLQVLPEYLNYDPFAKNAAKLTPKPACTTAAIKVGDYTCIMRNLDWPSYGFAGNYFIQMDRSIAGAKRTIDIGSPLVAGGLTLTNENGLFLEMNVANGEKVENPTGMPALFFNRFCAEKASSVAEVNKLIKEHRPLGAYHLTASDGTQTETIHFKQSKLVKNDDAIEVLNNDRHSPQLLAVANNGVVYKDDKAEHINYADSDERRENIHAFFNQDVVQKKLNQYIQKQEHGQILSPEEILKLKQLCLDIARLAIVNNCETQLCGIYVFFKDRLMEASASTDNLYAPSKELDQFKKLSLVS